MPSHYSFCRSLSRYALVAGLLTLGACTSFGQNAHFVVSVPNDCCDTFDTMAFKVLPAEQKVRLAINSDDPNFGFEGGYSHYEALTLPELSQPYVLQFESEVVRGNKNHRGEIFFPVLTFLDANKQKIKTFDTLPYTLQTPFYGRNHIRSSIRVGAKLAAARYVVVHTQDDKLEQSIATGDGKTVLQSKGFGSMIYAPITAPRFRINFAAKGWVRILAYSPQAG